MGLQKRTIVAVALSILIVIIYSSYVSKFYPVDNEEVTKKSSEGLYSDEPSPVIHRKPDIVQPTAPEQIKEFEYTPVLLERGNVNFEFSPYGGNLIKAKLKEYNYDVASKALFRTDNWSDLEFVPERKSDALVFRYQDEEKEIVKEYKILEGDHYLEVNMPQAFPTQSRLSFFLQLLVLMRGIKSRLLCLMMITCCAPTRHV